MKRLVLNAGRIILLTLGSLLLWSCLCAYLYSGYRWIDVPVGVCSGLFSGLWLGVRIHRPKPRPSIEGRIREITSSPRAPECGAGRILP